MGLAPPTPTKSPRRLPKPRKERTIFFKRSFAQEKGGLSMQYDTPGQRELPSVEHPMAVMETMIEQAIQQAQEMAVLSKRGRPARLSSQLLASGILWCVLHGWVSQLDLWRHISIFGVGKLMCRHRSNCETQPCSTHHK